MFQADLLAGRNIVVTGGGSGLGAEMARRFASLGAHVVVIGRRKEKVDAVAAEIGGTAYSCDIRDFGAVQEVAARVGSVDGLVNNAAGNFLAAAEDLTSNGFKTVVDIVLNGTFHCTSAFGRKMIEGRKGSIVNIVTTYAWTGSAFVLPSACAKAGVLAMTRTLAVEWARYKIRVNAIAPGPVHTEGASKRLFPDPMIEEGIRRTIPLRRFANLEEVANAAAYLLSDFASYVTGEAFVIDGGQWLSGADYWGRIKQMAPR